MHTEQLHDLLASTDAARSALAGWGLTDPDAGRRNLVALAATLGPDRLRELATHLARLLPRGPAPDMALNNLERLAARAVPADPAFLESLLERRAVGLEAVLQLIGTSQSLADVLVANPDCLDVVRGPVRRSPTPDELRDALQAEADAALDDAGVLRALRRFRQRHHLRIGANDVLRDRPLEEVTAEISRVADAALAVALRQAMRKVTASHGQPHTTAGSPARFSVLAFGKLGGEELNDSSEIDLVFLYDDEGTTRGRRGGVGNDEFFRRVAEEVVRLLSAYTDRGAAYRVDLRLRPDGRRGPIARSLPATLSYYDTLGRTWERQALVKARHTAGDASLGEEFLRAVEPFVYRKYLSVAEIHEIKAMKRRIEQQASRAGTDDTDVKTGRGGIRDIEFSVQFLQLLNGGDLPALRERNTLRALQALADAKCLTDDEFRFLDESYRFLRRVEHRLQLLFDLQTHRLPESPTELRRLARRMGYGTEMPTPARAIRPRRGVLDDAPVQDTLAARDLLVDPLDLFLHDLRAHTGRNREILNHLLQAFRSDDPAGEPEADLILDPHPDDEAVRAVLGRYPFRDVPAAYQNLTQLARESVRFLSSRRCRHFLAAIAPALLRAVAATPDPDLALGTLERVSASLGAKAVLWELFSVHPPSLGLYVDLCANSPLLSELLVNNPGMIDELLDSLLLNRSRTFDELRQDLRDLLRGAADPVPILHAYQSTEFLRIGVRDLLGRDETRATTAALSDVAEVILSEVAAWQEPGLRPRYGVPTLVGGGTCRYVILALGKLGGRELSYHSDLDLVFVYEGDGQTAAPAGAGRFERFAQVDNFQYFTELAQRIVRAASQVGPLGRLYPVDMRLRPTGRSGALALPLSEFRRYYDPAGPAQVWERQAMTRARPVHGEPGFAAEVSEAVCRAAYGLPWRPALADDVRGMRTRLESGTGPRSLKRGVGGIVDVEFAAQLLQLKYGPTDERLRVTSTWDALDAALTAGVLAAEDHARLRDGYAFLRRTESRLRVVMNRALTELPESADDVEKLARRLGYTAENGTSPGDRFRADRERHAREVRAAFESVLRRERA